MEISWLWWQMGTGRGETIRNPGQKKKKDFSNNKKRKELYYNHLYVGCCSPYLRSLKIHLKAADIQVKSKGFSFSPDLLSHWTILVSTIKKKKKSPFRWPTVYWHIAGNLLLMFCLIQGYFHMKQVYSMENLGYFGSQAAPGQIVHLRASGCSEI